MLPFFKFQQKRFRPYCSVIVAAAGSASRMKGVNKMLQPLDGIPILVRTLQVLQSSRCVDEIVIAAKEADIVEISSLCRTYGIRKCSKVIRGGESRVHSVYLAAMEASREAKLIAVQDGARPFITPELVDRVIEAAARTNAAAPAIPVKDTIKVAREDGSVDHTPDRKTLYAVQTPQVFEASLLKAALQSAMEEQAAITDDCSAVERLGKRVYLVDGDETNIKITTPMDLIVAEAILQKRENEA